MAELPILEYPDPRLRECARPVERFDESLRELVADLTETLHATKTIGLAASQAGDMRRVLVVEPTVDERAPRVYVNPEIQTRSGFCFVAESCLSLPGVTASVIRAAQVHVTAQDSKGQRFECDLSGMDAVCVQHEIDHLDGKLFIDRLSFLQKMLLRAGSARARRRAKAA